MLMNLITTFVIVSLAFSAPASSHDSSALRRNRHIRRLDYSSAPNVTARDETKALQKRFGPNSRFSWYHPGLGACGKTNGPNDFIVALTQTQFGNGEHCFEPITITYKGKTAQATIVDECMECPYGALDFSPGLFNFFGSTAEGYLYGSWEFGSGQDSKPKTTPPPPPPPPAPTTTTTKKAVPTTTWTPEPTKTSTTHEKAPAPTSTSTRTSTTSTHSATSSSAVSKQASSSVTSSTPTDSISTSVKASSTAVAVPTDNFGQLDLLMADLGAMLVGGVFVGAGRQ